MRFLLVFLFTLTGCQTYSTRLVQGPTGELAEITCRRGLGNCMDGASAYCGGSYEIVDRDSKTGVVSTTDFMTGRLNGVHSYSRDVLYVRCSN